MSANITGQQSKDIKSASTVSILVYESCDVNDTTQVSLFVRFISSTGPKEELLGFLPLNGQTRGVDIANFVIEYFETHKIPLDKIFSISTDGAKSMTGEKDGFVAIMKDKINHKILAYHCINHQEALCAQIFPEEIRQVMELVINITKSIIALPSHPQFKDFLIEVEKEYADVPLHSKVSWLSRGNVLKLFASLFTKIKAFLSEKNSLNHYAEVMNDMWNQKYYFMLDFISHLNQLNLNLQGRGNITFSMLEELISFENKLLLFADDFRGDNLIHFPSLLKYSRESNSEIDFSYFRQTLLNMRQDFLRRFRDLENYKATLAFIKNPVNATVVEINFSPFNIDIGKFSMQLLDLQNKEFCRTKFNRLYTELEQLEKKKSELILQQKLSALKDLDREDQLIFNAWESIPASFDQLKKLAFAVLSLFGSTYLCEQSFSNMNIVKNNLRNRLKDEYLESCLKLIITTYKADLP